MSATPTPAPQPDASLECFFELSLDLMCIADTNGWFKRVNPAFTRTLGWSQQELLARSFLDFVHPEDRPAAVREMARLAAGQPASYFENRYRHLDGSWRVLAWQAAPQADGTIYAIARDVTEQRAAVQALREASRINAATLDALVAHVAVLDATGTILSTNRAWREFAAANGSEVHAVSEGANYLTACERAASRGDVDAVRAAQALRVVIAGELGEWMHEYPCHSRDEERWFFCRFTRFAGDGPVRVVVSHENISAMKRAQAGLHESIELFESLARVAPVGIYRTDAEGRCVYVNEHWCEISGQSPEQAVGDGWINAIHPEDRSQVLREWVRATTRQKAFKSEFRIQRPGGAFAWVRGESAALNRQDGHHLGHVGVVFDITTLKQSEEALRILSSTTASPHGDEFFRLVVRHLAELAGMDIGFVGRLIGEERTHIGTLAIWAEGQFQPNYGYPLEGTPCEDVVGRELCLYADRVQELFPKDRMLVEANVVSYAAIPLFDEQGRPQGLLGVLGHKPIAHPDQIIALLRIFAVRTAAEVERQRSAQQFMDLFEFAPDALVMTNRAGKVTLVNRQAEEMFGWPRAELVGQPVEVLMPEARRDQHMGQREQYMQTAPLRSMGAGRSDLHGRRKDGSIFPVEISLSPMESPDGRVVAAAVRDITARVQAEQQMRQALAMLDATDDAAYVFDPETLRLSYVNEGAVRQSGHPREELMAMSFAVLNPEFKAAGQGKTLVRMLRGELRAQRLVTHHQRRDGHHFPVEINLQYVTLPDQPPRCIAMVRDITERQRNERLAQRSQRMESIGTLAGGVAHDLNNSLAPILMAIETLRLRYPDESEVLDILENNTRRGANMVRQLLTFARGAEGDRMFVPVHQLIKELQSIIRGTFPKNIHVEVVEDPLLPGVLGDITQLHQVLLNLCVNARDAMPYGGTLWLEAERCSVDAEYARTVPDAHPGDYVVLRVRDTGTGIPANVMERIFDPFFTTKPPDKGTGLGLSTALGIVRSHDGFLQVSSEPGKGSTFAVYLPVELTQRQPPTPERLRPSITGQGELILFVDDEPSLREMAQNILGRLNFNVATATDGADALAQIASHRTELRAIITDLHMPLMDGLELVRRLRRLLPDIPVVVSSGRMEEELRQEFEALGVQLHLDKPYSQQELSDALKTALSTVTASQP